MFVQHESVTVNVTVKVPFVVYVFDASIVVAVLLSPKSQAYVVVPVVVDVFVKLNVGDAPADVNPAVGVVHVVITTVWQVESAPQASETIKQTV